jgi:GH24 family phage-related lysozyme (muramidase)
MPEVTLEGIARSQLSVEQNHALDILVNLPTAQFNYLKLSILELDIPGVVAPATLDKFLEFCQKHGFDLSEDGVNEFKDSRNLGNTGLLRGVIGPQTAGAYYTAIIGKLTLSVASSSANRSINQAGIDLVKEFEGLHEMLPDGRIKAYLDPVDVVTIGWGHTEGVRFGDIITVAEAEAFLKQDLEEAGKDVSKYVQVSLTDNQFSALASFIFNVGSAAFADSTLCRLLNEGNYQAAANQFTRWVHGTVDGRQVVLQGLVRRIEAEKALFFS